MVGLAIVAQGQEIQARLTGITPKISTQVDKRFSDATVLLTNFLIIGGGQLTLSTQRKNSM